MRHRSVAFTAFLLSATMVLSLTCAPVAGQVSQRGYSSRGVNSFGSRGGVGVIRPSYNRPTAVVPAGPLSFGNSYSSSGPTFDIGSYAPFMGSYAPFIGGADMAAWNNLLMQGDSSLLGTESMPGMRPSIRPRLDIEERNVTNSNRVLKGIRDSVLEQLSRCAERPFSAAWYAAHSSVTPIQTEGGDAWSGSDWEAVKSWVGLTVEPQSYDFRPDPTGLIFVYRNQERLGCAVDARGPARELAQSPISSQGESLGLSLGVFAEVPPIEQPVKTLLHLVVGKTGSIAGYQYDLATDAMTPLLGAFDPLSQRVAWQVGDDVMEAGFENLTREITRALLFRHDGWTQSWMLMRISPATPAASDAASVEKTDAASQPDSP